MRLPVLNLITSRPLVGGGKGSAFSPGTRVIQFDDLAGELALPEMPDLRDMLAYQAGVKRQYR